MEKDSVENLVKNLGPHDFGQVARLILSKFLGFVPIDVDGKGDAGSDLMLFTNDKRTARIAVQITVQDGRWEEKAFNDARKSAESLRATRYLFLTSRARERAKLLAVENRISNDLGIYAQCWGATEVAGILTEQKLLGDFANAINLDCFAPLPGRPDSAQILLHVYAVFGPDRENLRNEVYDDSLLYVMHSSPTPLRRDRIIEQAAKLFDASPFDDDRLSRRFDSLLTRRKIVKGTDGLFRLSGEAAGEISIANEIYAGELRQLEAQQSKHLLDHCGVAWGEENSRMAAIHISRWFLLDRLSSLDKFSVPRALIGWRQSLGDPEGQLRGILASVGVRSAKQQQSILEMLINDAAASPLIHKLARGVTYVATKGASIPQASIAIGAASWSEVTVVLDSSVAIPFLVSRLFSATTGRFSKGSGECVRLLLEAGAKVVVPWEYLNEIASHLQRALGYENAVRLAHSPTCSENGFIAPYCQLKEMGRHVPATVREYVSKFSRAALLSNDQSHTLAVMQQIGSLLDRYGVDCEEPAEIVPATLKSDIESAFDYRMKDRSRPRPSLLVKHDVDVMARSRLLISRKGRRRICLTWDAVLILVGRDVGDCGLIVSPLEAADLVESKSKANDRRLMSLAHSLARVRERPSEIAARVIDRAVSIASEKLDDWQVREKIDAFLSDLIDRIEVGNESFAAVDLEIDAFFRQVGIIDSMTVPEQ